MVSPFTFVTNKPASSDPINQGPALFQAQWAAIKAALMTLLPNTVTGVPTTGWRVLQDGNSTMITNNVATWVPGGSSSQDDTSLYSWAIQYNTNSQAPLLWWSPPGGTTFHGGQQLQVYNIGYNQGVTSYANPTTSTLSTGFGVQITPGIFPSAKIRAVSYGTTGATTQGFNVGLWQSTVGIPAAGAAPGGSDIEQITTQQLATFDPGVYVACPLQYRATGLTLGTTYYFYLSLVSYNPGQTTTLTNWSIIVEEG